MIFNNSWKNGIRFQKLNFLKNINKQEFTLMLEDVQWCFKLHANVSMFIINHIHGVHLLMLNRCYLYANLFSN